MKTKHFILIAFLPVTVFAFDLGGLKDKLKSESAETESESSGFNIQAMAKQLEGVFASASPQVKSAINGVVKNYTDGNDLGIFKHLDTIKSAKLSSEQVAVWNRAKTDVMAAVMERNFSFENVRASGLVENSLNALRSGDVAALGSTYNQLKGVVSLTPEQKKLFGAIQENAAPIKDKTVDGIKSLFGS